MSTRHLLLDHAIAGLSHHVTADVLRTIHEGDLLELVREPDNRFDANAVRIDLDGTKLGYVPATYSQIVAGLLDIGVKLTADVGDTINAKKALCHFRLWVTRA